MLTTLTIPSFVVDAYMLTYLLTILTCHMGFIVYIVPFSGCLPYIRITILTILTIPTYHIQRSILRVPSILTIPSLVVDAYLLTYLITY